MNVDRHLRVQKEGYVGTLEGPICVFVCLDMKAEIVLWMLTIVDQVRREGVRGQMEGERRGSVRW